MQNEKQAYISRQTNEEQSIDIKQLLFTALHYWYLFLIAVAVALVIGFFVNRYSTKVYQTSGTVLIKEGRSGYDATSIMTSNSFGSYQNIDNEIAILRSYTLTDRVVKKMGIEVTYMEKGRFSMTEMYKTSPFLVEFERSVPQAVGLTYEITLFDDDKIQLHAIGEGLTKYDFILCQQTESHPYDKIDIGGEYQQGEWIDNGYNKIRITKTDRFDSKNISGRKFFFCLNSYPTLVRKMSSFSVSPITKQASVASVVMKGTDRTKIVEFVNMLMNEYVNRGLEKKNVVSENTIEFIDNELSGIQESLNQAETELKDFRQQNDAMNIDLQTNQVYTNLRSLEKERA